MQNDFHAFATKVEARFKQMSAGELFVVDVGNIFETYLASFPEGTNPIFRERTEHDCNCCKQFIRKLGVLVSAEGGVVSTVWDVEGLPYPYDVVAKRLDDVVRQAPIKQAFRTKERQYGTEYNYDSKTNQRWNHFHGRVADKHFTEKPGEALDQIGDIIQVMRRGLVELKPEAFQTVLDIIDAKDLYRGEEFKPVITAFQKLQREYLASDNKELFIWANINDRSARFRNTVIGGLLVELSEGVEVDRAVRGFEAKVAPTNYKRPTAVITPKMVEQAVETLQSLGLEGAVQRRFAKIDDVSVNNVIFVDNSVQSKMKDGIAGLLMDSVKPAKVNVKHAEAISAEDFFSTIVPQATGIEVLVENAHMGNFVSLTAPVNQSAGKLFRWENDFAWSYDGEVTDSIKQRVKAAGGNVNAKLRISLAWFNRDDLDIHCFGPDGHIFYRAKQGILDVDMNAGGGFSRTPVENLSWKTVKDGEYRIAIDQFNKRENFDFGFTLEVEGLGRFEQFSYNKAVTCNTDALTLTIEGGIITNITVASGVIGGSASSDKWGIKTQTLVPVDTLMLSPNHWDGQGVGNRHWFFFLKGCKNPDPARGIYNEFLRPDLEKHRKVFEVLGSKTKCPYQDEQLSGLGFSSTRGDSVVAVVKGQRINKAFKITF